MPPYIMTLEATQMVATVEQLIIITSRTELVYITPKYVKTYSRPARDIKRRWSPPPHHVYRLVS